MEKHEGVVSRDEELAVLTTFLHRLDDLPQVLVVAGKPGIGKTTLWRQAVVEADRMGYRVLSCSPAGAETELAFAALRDLLDPVYDDAVASLPAPQRSALDVALLRVDAIDGAPERGAVAAGCLGAVRALAENAPVLLAVDDVQWLDPSSAATIEFVLRRLAQERVAALFAKRDEDGGTALDLERAVPAGRFDRLHVGPMSLDAVHRLLHQGLGVTLARPTLRRVHELSGGNPFFALEVARALERRGGRIVAGEALPVPAELQELVRDRLSALPDEVLGTVQFAAALSRPKLALVLNATEHGARGMDAAVEAHIVQIEDDRVSFTHPLLASTAYSMLAPGRRQGIHERLAGMIDEPEERARHLALAASGPDSAVASELDVAAALALARGARASAAELFEQAARLTPPECARDLRRRTADAGYLHFQAGDSQRGRRMLEGLAAELPPGPERANVLIRLAYTRTYDDDLHAATELFFQAEQEAGEDRRLRAEALSNLAGTLFRRRQRLPEAIEYSKEAAKLARTLGDSSLLADALGQQLLAEAGLARPEATATLKELLPLQRENDRARLLSQPKVFAAIVRMWWEELEWAQGVYEELLERGRESGEEALIPYVYVMAAQNECLLGRFESAAAHADAGREIAEQAGEATLASYALALRALADAHRGWADDARAAAESARAVAEATRGTPTLLFAAAALGLLELSCGRPKEAVNALTPIVTFARNENLVEPGMTRFITDYAEALVELARVDEAEEVLQAYEAHSLRLGRRGAYGSALRCRGLVSAARGKLEDALATLERARAEHEAAPLPFELARTRLVQGATLRRAKRKRDAREALEAARSKFERLGARLWVERSVAELARIGGRTASQGQLTPTEQRVAQLVAEGFSTKEVAAALFVSPKTVEGHLSKIYAKLGVRSRAELAHSFAPIRSDA